MGMLFFAQLAQVINDILLPVYFVTLHLVQIFVGFSVMAGKVDKAAVQMTVVAYLAVAADFAMAYL